MINRLGQLTEAICAAIGRPVSVSQDNAIPLGPYSHHTHPNGTLLRVNYDDGLPADAAGVSAVIQAFVDVPTEGEKLDGLPLQTKVLAALAIRWSDRWASLSQARKNRLQEIINNAANAAIAKLSD